MALAKLLNQEVSTQVLFSPLVFFASNDVQINFTTKQKFQFWIFVGILTSVLNVWPKKSFFHISVLITVELQHQKQSSSHRNTLKVTTGQEVLQCLQLVNVKHWKASLGCFSHSSVSQDLAQPGFQTEKRTNSNEEQAAACSTKHTGQPKSQLTKLNYQPLSFLQHMIH